MVLSYSFTKTKVNVRKEVPDPRVFRLPQCFSIGSFGRGLHPYHLSLSSETLFSYHETGVGRSDREVPLFVLGNSTTPFPSFGKCKSISFSRSRRPPTLVSFWKKESLSRLSIRIMTWYIKRVRLLINSTMKRELNLRNSTYGCSFVGLYHWSSSVTYEVFSYNWCLESR